MHQLPLELIEMIADQTIDIITATEFRNSRAKLVHRLRILALVSRLWSTLCQKVLFSQYTLGNFNPRYEKVDLLQLPRFVFLIMHPHLATYVTHLRIFAIWMIDELETVLERIPDVLSNVASFTIDDCGQNSIFDMGMPLAGFIDRLPRISHLNFHYTFIDDSNFAEQAAFQHIRLNSLYIFGQGDDVAAMLEALSALPTAQSLKEITVDLRHGHLGDDNIRSIHRTWTKFINCANLELQYSCVQFPPKGEFSGCSVSVTTRPEVACRIRSISW
jgi:hypothetical protein